LGCVDWLVIVELLEPMERNMERERDVANSSSDRGVQDLQNVADQRAGGRTRKLAVNGADVRRRVTPREAWKEPEDMDQKTNDGTRREDGKTQRRSLWLMRSKRFCHEASVVGLRYAASPTASQFRRSVWVFLLLVGATFTTFQIQNRIRCYLSRPVNVNMRIEHAEQMMFPTVTICNENRITRAAAEYVGKYQRLMTIFTLIAFGLPSRIFNPY